jgi:biopolymer transport protein ExbD
MAGTSQGRGPIVGINVTPMVDVVLVLLVIMMVSATYIVAQSLKVELPKTATADDPTTSPSAVTITKDRKFFFNQQPATEAELRAHFAAATAGGADPNLIVSADEAVPHGVVVHVIDLAKLAGITKFAINVEHSE